MQKGLKFVLADADKAAEAVEGKVATLGPAATVLWLTCKKDATCLRVQYGERYSVFLVDIEEAFRVRCCGIRVGTRAKDMDREMLFRPFAGGGAG